MFLTRISVSQPVFATMVMLALVVLGYFSYQRMPVEQFPNIDFPVVVVQTVYPGAAPETVENDVTRPIEEVVNTVTGLDTLNSRSYPGVSVVIIQFDLEMNSSTAAQEVRDKVATIAARLPEDAGDPQISRFDPMSMPIMSVIVSSETLPLRELTAYADETIVDRLSIIPGVGSATVIGGVKRQINILVDEERLRALGVGIADVTNALSDENRDIPAGEITVGVNQRNVVVEGRIDDPNDFRTLVVARRGGEPVYLWQVATIVDGEADTESRALLNGTPAVAIDIIKIPGSNTIEVADGIHGAIATLQAELPGDVKLNVIRDGSVAIRNSVEDVQTTLVEGGFLAVLIVFLFLNSWRSTVITGLTLPVSVIGTFTVLNFLGFTLNMMTLMALSLAIGILIDDAIVVRENITRHLRMGKTHRQAALEGTKEIGLAVLATSLSIVAVFLPVAFMGGIIGRFFLQFGVTVAVAVLLSLFVSFTLDPMLSSVWYDPASGPNPKRGPIGKLVNLFDRGFEAIGRGYGRVVKWVLRHRFITLLGAFAIFVASVMLTPLVGAEFVPQTDEGEFNLELTTPVGSSSDYTTAKVRQVENALREFPEVEAVYTTINAGNSQGTNRANVYVKMVPKDDRERSPIELTEPIRQRLASIAGVESSFALPGVGGSQKPIQINVLGTDVAVLGRISDELVAKLSAVPGAVDVDSSLAETRPILGVRVDRDRASDLGISMQQIANALRPMLSGDAATTWKSAAGETYDVVVRLPEEQRVDMEALAGLPLIAARADGGQSTIRLDQVAEIVTSASAAEITRQDLSRQLQVSANVAGGVPVAEVSTAVFGIVAGMELPPGYRFAFGGDTEAMAESMGYAAQALIMAVLFIYFVIASQFGSFLQPIAIMISMPMALIGVIAGLYVGGSTLNMMSAIGFIMLMGLVTKNAILLVDFANRRRKEGVPLKEALAEAGVIRFRPIIMTTTAMIFGMMPLALGLGQGGEFRGPMAHAVIGGLLSSTFLTLLVVPVMISYLDSLGRRVRKLFPKAPVDHAPESALPEPERVVAYPTRPAYPEAAE